jgi:hypothetical protein
VRFDNAARELPTWKSELKQNRFSPVRVTTETKAKREGGGKNEDEECAGSKERSVFAKDESVPGDKGELRDVPPGESTVPQNEGKQ